MKFTRRTKIGAIGVIVLVLFAVGGSGFALAQDSGSSPFADSDDDDSIAASDVSLSEEEALNVATDEAEGDVAEVELESEDGTPVYEVELVTADGTETEVAVDANDGTVLETESEAEEDDEMEDDENDEMEDDESVVSSDVSLSEEEALNVATDEAEGDVAEVELESEDGTAVYEIELVTADGTETEVAVDANDGTVLETATEHEQTDD